MVIPDIMALASTGERAECRREASQRQGASGGHEGVKGLRALGVRDLSYRLAFIANSVQVSAIFLMFVWSTTGTIFLLFLFFFPFFHCSFILSLRMYIKVASDGRGSNLRSTRRDVDDDDDSQHFTVGSWSICLFQNYIVCM